MDVCPYNYFWYCGYSKDFWVAFLTTDDFSVGVKKVTSAISFTLTHNLPLWFLSDFFNSEISILSELCNQGNFESRSFLNLSFTNIHGLYSNFIAFESLLESSFCDVHTFLELSVDSSHFSVRGFFLLIFLFHFKSSFCS